ncbi:MAG: winged helix-turn-helix domain-containing protein [Gammaproteobacteria bacterium]|jgi:DNA-binding winged helix-turn-helix (wHTH) protein
MTCRFGEFELDESARELRLNGIEIPLQPRVFDLLTLLYRNRERVMSKEELMDALWPGIVVGEGSLQRAVSLARSALKSGGMGGAIRNFSRRGYRFCVDEDVSPRSPESDIDPLESARAAFERGAWDTAIAEYERADAESALGAIDLECFADACQTAGRAGDAEPLLERAVAAYSAKGDERGAAKAALYLAEIAFEFARIPVVHGWLTRARRYLKGCEEGVEHGFEAYVAARVAVATGDPEAAVEHGRRGLSIGERIGSEGTQALARIYLGYGEIALGDYEAGIRHVDDAAASVLSDDIQPRVRGIVYCGLIWLCCNRGDWQRAAQWGDSFDRWCESEGRIRFTGLCQLHRAEVLSVSGDTEKAEKEIRIACDQLSAYSPFAAGDAFRIFGDLYLMRGDLDRAEAAYRRTHELGWDPQPGLALLQAERGQSETAIRGLLRSLEDKNWALRQRRGLLLAILAIIAARAGDRDHAAIAIGELDRHPELWTSEHNNGAVARARAELAVLDGKLAEAFTAMREAIRSWQAAHAGLNTAICRFRLAQLLADDGDVDGALLELDAAQASFDTLQAPLRARRCSELRSALTRNSAKPKRDDSRDAAPDA